MKDNYKINSWLLASRPKTLLAGVIPVMVGSALAISSGKFYPILSIIALFCSVLIQIGTNFTNDLYDFLKGSDTKQRKGPTRVLASGLISVNEMKVGIVAAFSLAFLLGLYLVYSSGTVILIFGVVSIIAGILYTAGPFPLAYNGLGDLFVFLFFGIAGTMGTYYLHAKEFSLLSFLVSLPVGALTTNILVVNNYRDIEEDKAAGKNTLAVYLGRTFTRCQFITMFLLCYFISVILFTNYNFNYWIFLPYFTTPLTVILVKMLFTFSGEALNKTLELTAKFAGLYGLLFSIGLIV
jgi:1,4-dihydroxy-2-naphthoate octaprenyltransferase